MPKSPARGRRLRREFNLWKKRIPALIVFLFPTVLLIQATICYVNPQNYPVSASYLTRTRYDATLHSQTREVYSIPTFEPCSVNSKIDYVITLTSMEKIGVTCTVVSYLLDNDTPLDLVQDNLLPINAINDLTVVLNGQTLTPFLSEINGTPCYTVNGFNLTNTGQVETLVTSFDMEGTLSINDSYINIPWVFNNNYVQYTFFPAFNVPVGENLTSEGNTLEIDFGLPFRQLVTSESGWTDSFDEPASHWTFLNSSAWYEPAFTRPINQTIETNGNTYYFGANFSEQNVASSSLITVTPSLNVILFFLPFMLSPFYIISVEYGINRYEKRKTKNSQVKKGIVGGFFRFVYGFILPFTGIVISFTVYLTGSFGQLFPLLSYLIGIMNPVGFFVLCYPIISYIILSKTISKA